ncbi:hypothetical protein BGP75_11860 [Motiliproteus sp. MSK22-1]|nr:hypothetical protein BGP75_11860 [Motiliproteus sp. MSK22-1]
MENSQPIPRNSLVWLLASMFAGIAPHFSRLPLWVIAVCLLCGSWRIMVYRSRWKLPGRWIKALLVFSSFAAVLGHYGTLFGPDAGTALLILGFCFKLLETHNRKDAFTVVVLGFFVVATAFFYTQSMLSAGYLLLVCFMVTAALIGLNQTPLQTDPKRTARRAFKLLLQSIPLMLVLFVFVPRVAPLWSLDLSGSRAKTGLSDRITPGDIAELSRSPELAFRVEFEGSIPDTSKLYWRGLVLDHYDGATWSRGVSNNEQSLMDREPMVAGFNGEGIPWQASVRFQGDQYRYRVIMEPTDKRWLFALPAARSENRRVGFSRDFRLLSDTPISQPFSYSVSSDLRFSLDTSLPRWLAQRNLQLPETGNPRSRQLAERLLKQSKTASSYVTQVLTFFSEKTFSYTLRPPRLTGDRIDQFLFETRQGFCSHYAGAFVYLMRSAGIPARIVAGYQGGEINPLGGHLLVHQFDAHAWAEVWLPGQGWKRADPTAVIAPSRVEQGVEEALSEEQSFLEDSVLSPLRYRSINWLTQFRFAWDYVNFAWHRSVLGYDAKLQADFLSRLLGPVDFKKLGLIMVLLTTLVLLGLAGLLFLNRRGHSRDPLLQIYLKFCKRMAAKGIRRMPGESAGEYLQRLIKKYPDKASEMEELTDLYTQATYSSNYSSNGEGSQQATLSRMKRLLRTL